MNECADEWMTNGSLMREWMDECIDAWQRLTGWM